jgi:type VII secretion protein EccB
LATKRDLVEAHTFSRRRLVTAFVSGAPGGREVEPARPSRAIVGGLVIGVLLLAGALIAGVFVPKPADLRSVGLFQATEDTETYIVLEEAPEGKLPVLHPVRNVTSARLILGEFTQDGDLKPTAVSQEAINSAVIGETLGIDGAPEDVPELDNLIATGWTACTNDGAGVQLNLADEPSVSMVPPAGFVVESNGSRYLIAHNDAGPTGQAFRYELPTRGGVDTEMLAALDLLPATSRAPEVSDKDWLSLFPAGGDLDLESFQLAQSGAVFAYADEAGIPGEAKIGDVAKYQSSYWVLQENGMAALDDFAAAVYLVLFDGASKKSKPRLTPKVHELSEWPDAPMVAPGYAAANWPSTKPAASQGPYCAILNTAVGAKPQVSLATEPTGSALAEGLAANEVAVTVEPGHGAFVLSGDWSNRESGTPFVVDSRGVSYALVGSYPETGAALGYADYSPVVAPDPWVELFADGVSLSVEAALCPPTLDLASCGD